MLNVGAKKTSEYIALLLYIEAFGVRYRKVRGPGGYEGAKDVKGLSLLPGIYYLA